MNSRRWMAILVIAGVVGGLFLVWRYLAIHGKPAASVKEGNSAQDALVSEAPTPVPPAPVTNLPPATGAIQPGVNAAEPASIPVPSALPLEEIRFKHAATLVKVRQDVWEYRQRLKTEDVPAETRDLFRGWAMELYRDSLIFGMGELPANDPVVQELDAAFHTDAEPRLAMIQKSGLEPMSVSRTSDLLSKVAALPGNPGRPEALGMAQEFEHLFKKAKQRSDSDYMSEMKDLLIDPQASVDEKVEFVERFVEIRDLAMAEYSREYFQELLQEPGLDQNQLVKVQDLLRKISQMRMP